jgi:hypothetical protein
MLLAACSPDPGGDSDGPEDSRVPTHGWGLEAHADPTVGSMIRLSWEQPETDTVQVQWLDGMYWVGGPGEERQAGPQEALLLGVPYGAEIELFLHGRNGDSETVTVANAPLPKGLAHAELRTIETSAAIFDMAGVFTSSVGMTQGESWSLILDRAGRIVWALRSPDDRLTLQPRISRDGSALLIDHNSFYGSLDGGAGSQVQRLAIDGDELAIYDTPGLHHGFTETADGRIAWGATDGSSYDSLEILDADGTQRRLWSCEGFFAGLGVAQACQNNGLAWTEDGDRFLLSLWDSDSLVEIDAEGEPLRWFGQLPGAWSFAEAGTAFRFQHGAHMTTAGTLLLSTHRSAMDEELLVREYSLDEDAERLVQAWSHGSGLDAALGGSVERLPGGNTLHGTGSAGHILEIAPDGTTVWELSLPGTYLGRVGAIEDLYALVP